MYGPPGFNTINFFLVIIIIITAVASAIMPKQFRMGIFESDRFSSLNSSSSVVILSCGGRKESHPHPVRFFQCSPECYKTSNIIEKTGAINLDNFSLVCSDFFVLQNFFGSIYFGLDSGFFCGETFDVNEWCIWRS